MSKLKWNWAYLPYLDPPEKQRESALNAGYIKVVSKSEADAIIADLEKNLDLYKRGFKEDDRLNSYLYAELRRQKYRRCLAMAEMCKARYDKEDAKENWCGLSWEYISKEMKYWERWRNRWMKLAEMFK